MRNQLRIKLGRLASLEFQLEFCVRSSSSEYVLPNEMVESAISLVKSIVGTPKLAAAYSDHEHAVLREFLDSVEVYASDVPFDDSSASNEELITKNPAWLSIRKSAADCMLMLGLGTPSSDLLDRH